jgi:hypothetical protein
VPLEDPAEAIALGRGQSQRWGVLTERNKMFAKLRDGYLAVQAEPSYNDLGLDGNSSDSGEDKEVSKRAAERCLVALGEDVAADVADQNALEVELGDEFTKRRSVLSSPYWIPGRNY